MNKFLRRVIALNKLMEENGSSNNRESYVYAIKDAMDRYIADIRSPGEYSTSGRILILQEYESINLLPMKIAYMSNVSDMELIVLKNRFWFEWFGKVVTQQDYYSKSIRRHLYWNFPEVFVGDTPTNKAMLEMKDNLKEIKIITDRLIGYNKKK